MKINNKKYPLKLIYLLPFTFVLIIILADVFFPVAEMPQYSKTILAADSTLLTSYLTDDEQWRIPASLNEVSNDFLKSIIEKEDKWFYWHLGINPVSLVKSLFRNVRSGKIESGASTITMQLVRMLEPRERTYINKLIEMFRAIQIELHFSKKEILEKYINLLPYGGNVQGIKSASYIFFNRPPSKLSLAQSVTLAVIPNNPNELRIDRNVEEVKKFRDVWIRRFIENEIFEKQHLIDALYEELLSRRYEIPKIAPHFCQYVKETSETAEVNSSLNMKNQNIAEKLLKQYVEKVFYKNVTNASALIIDNKNHSISAYVGSADFYNSLTSGQVDGIRAVRSPGSALKPFLYAMGFDLGMITPKSRLTDIPTDFGGYSPENFDEKFNGNVTVQFSLLNSLNVPAVFCLRDLGLSKFVNLLSSNGFKSIDANKNRLGLSVILGGCGVTLYELTSFYSSLANGGKYFSLSYNSEDTDIDSKIIFSESAAYLTAKILSGNERLDIPLQVFEQSKLPRFAWKTGTSYGKRDAWAVGFNSNYTIGVWLGNFDGSGSPHLSGAEMAVPMLFDLFNSIDYASERWSPLYPEQLGEREVCKLSGKIPTKLCKDRELDNYIIGVSSNETCSSHKEIYTNEDETIQYCTECLPKSGYKKVVIDQLSPELELWMSTNTNAADRIRHNPDCDAKFNFGGPKITSPSQDFKYMIERSNRTELLLQAANEKDIYYHYWFVNGLFLGRTEVNEKLFYLPESENLEITCVDDKGRTSKSKITIQFY